MRLPGCADTRLAFQYTSEAARALVDAPLVLRDVPAAVQAASYMHQRYAEFGPELLSALAAALQSAPGEPAGAGAPLSCTVFCID